PFNVLVWEGGITVIDLPQAVDPKKNRHAEALLGRDVRRICEHFARYGAVRDPVRVASDLWTSWTFADLVPEELRIELQMESGWGEPPPLERFLPPADTAPMPERRIATVVMLDVVGSTAIAAQLGDARYR